MRKLLILFAAGLAVACCPNWYPQGSPSHPRSGDVRWSPGESETVISITDDCRAFLRAHGPRCVEACGDGDRYTMIFNVVSCEVIQCVCRDGRQIDIWRERNPQ